MKLVLWNVEWNPTGRIREYVRGTLRAESPDILCLTESTNFFASDYANVIASTGDYGYANEGDRRKVWLVSRHEWTSIEHGEGSDLPPGRFVSGITKGIRFVGVCVPWFDAKRVSDHPALIGRLVGEQNDAREAGLRAE
jgi:hypothetical protein